MSRALIDIIESDDPALRDTALDAVCRDATAAQLLAHAEALDAYRRGCDNLYFRVRALFFLYAIHRFHLPTRLSVEMAGGNLPGAGVGAGLVPFGAYQHLLERRFQEAIDHLLAAQQTQGPSDGLCSALARAYHELGFQTLADQVRRSVRSVRGNQWMFRMGHPADQPLRLRRELLARDAHDGSSPILTEATAVRMDLTHSGWSDIFFLGMDYPEGAQVLNVSIDLAVRGRDPEPRPPIATFLRVIDEPVIRLVSLDLGARAEVRSLDEVFDFARDYLGLLKSALIASGVVPAGLEGAGRPLEELLARMIGPGRGLEIVSQVRDIPKGSRLAVSTNLLASLIALLMRATGQTASLTGPLEEDERRLVAARAILGEWLGGSGGGWQDSGGVWPGIKLITGQHAQEGDPEFGISRGRLMPTHRVLGRDVVTDDTRRRLAESLVLVHGGMAQDVGPILEMVTEKYLLRAERETTARAEAIAVMRRVLDALAAGDIRELGRATTDNFRGPIQAIIPWATNRFTETLIERTAARFGERFWGFWMLGGMSGGGMGFIVDPSVKEDAQTFLAQTMSDVKRELEHALPFAMEPVVYDFAINERGTTATLLTGDAAMMPAGYYALVVPDWLRSHAASQSAAARRELERFGSAYRDEQRLAPMARTLFERMVPRRMNEAGGERSLAVLLVELGFDREQHEQVRAAMKAGRIGLAQNRLPASSTIRDVEPGDVVDARAGLEHRYAQRGRAALEVGEVGVISLAAGAGSRWTGGAGVVKALHPFCKFGERHRSFLELHLAKSARVGREVGTAPAHLITTSYLTHEPIRAALDAADNFGYDGPLMLSPGRSVGLRMIPMERDLRFAWEEMPQQRLDEQAQKMQDSLHAALIHWARDAGEATDYTDNLPLQCLHPVGHWYELPNLLRNGVLRELLAERPRLRYLMLHNIDTLGADLDPVLLGLHIEQGHTLSFEVITRRIEDRGGGLARVDGRVRLVEGLAMPREEDEFHLSLYNTMTTWIDLDQLLGVFGLQRDELGDEAKVSEAIRRLAGRMPTYLTLKDVKKRWGHGQEDVYPVAQFEKLWSDLTALPEVGSGFVIVDRQRGQQLKEPAQLDAWLRDGSAAYVAQRCGW